MPKTQPSYPNEVILLYGPIGAAALAGADSQRYGTLFFSFGTRRWEDDLDDPFEHFPKVP